MMMKRHFSGKRLLGVLLATTLVFQSATVSYATEPETEPQIEVSEVDVSDVVASDLEALPETEALPAPRSLPLSPYAGSESPSDR